MTLLGRLTVRVEPEPLVEEALWTSLITETRWAGAVAVSEVAEATVTPVAATPPKATVAPLAKLVPVTVTTVPPAAGPLDGLMALTVGTGPETPEATTRAPMAAEVLAGTRRDVGATAALTLVSKRTMSPSEVG